MTFAFTWGFIQQVWGCVQVDVVWSMEVQILYNKKDHLLYLL